jgi:hypothetical protein
MSDDPSYIYRSAREHGWLRRPELDTPNCDVWELPSGTLWLLPKGETPTIVTLKSGFHVTRSGRPY